MTRKGLWTCAGVWSIGLAAGAGLGIAQAADLVPGPGPFFGPPPMEWIGPVYGYFDPVMDPRCRIVPMPQANLYGDTARFRPTAVCQSRGLYVDSVVLP